MSIKLIKFAKSSDSFHCNLNQNSKYNKKEIINFKNFP